MSSAEEDYNDNGDNLGSTGVPDNKKRRVQRACDTCRRKKIRCDGSQMPGNRCSNCIAYTLECTYVEAAKKRGPPKGYVESLENRLEKMERLLQKVCPDADFSSELGGGRIDRETWQKSNMGGSTSGHTISASTAPGYGNANVPIEDLVPTDDEDTITLRLSNSLKSMTLGNARRQNRFFGKSSGVMLIRKAIDLKKEVTGTDDNREHFFHSIEDNPYPWELAARHIEEPEYMFPDVELGMKLLKIYFEQVNSLVPLLHRPSFERKVIQGVHLRNTSFAAVYLLVCAVASRFSDDPRVFLEKVDSKVVAHSAGWKYFEQVQMVRKTLLGPPCLEDLQTYCLCVLFLQGTSAPQACWTIVGVGIRLAQDVGAHRRKSYDAKLSVEGELWKRTFWVLVMLDRQMSTSLGRPSAIQDEDFDLDYPVDCDDEYWEHPDPQQAFKQPSDKPSSISFFISFIKLYNILSFAHRTIYSINKSKILLGFVGQQWEQHIVAELDSSLNKWIDEVPDHLRWDPTRDTSTPFMMQSTTLYVNYYYLQIFIHRPFIPSPRKPSPLSFPSLAICTNAARSCSHVIDIYRKRVGGFVPFLQMPAFTAGIVLLLNIWGGKRSGLSTDPVKEMADVHKCMGALKACEGRWHSSGRLWDILYELASVGDLPLPQPSPGGTKRERDSDSPPPDSRPTSMPNKDGFRTIAGMRRISREVHTQAQHSRQSQSQQQQSTPPALSQSSPPAQSPQQPYQLPVYSNDLGRLPVHGQLTFGIGGTGSVPTNSGLMRSPSSPNMWFSSSSSSSLSSSSGVERKPPSMVGHSYEHGHGGNAYSLDDLFLDQITGGSYGGFGAPQTHGASDLNMHGFMDASVLGGVGGGGASSSPSPHSMIMPGTTATTAGGIFDVDSDTMAMWSSAPTSFGVNDWGTYLSSVSGIIHSDGLSGSGSGSHAHHGKHQI